MPRVPNAPPPDIFGIDLTPSKSFLVNLPAGALIGMRREQPGFPAVFQEIISNQAMYGERAGVTATNYAKFVTLNEQHGWIRANLPLVEKALEVLRESLAHVDNLRHRLAAAFADDAESHAHAEGDDTTLLTAYEKTITYRGVIASKSSKTRKKNEAAKRAQDRAAAASDATGAAASGATGAAELTGATAAVGAITTSAAAAKTAEKILRIPNPPPDSIFHINLAPLQGFLVDLPPNAMIGMRRRQAGWEAVFFEITSNQAAYGERAGITATDFAKFVSLNEQYEKILAQLPLVEKAVEVLTQSLAHIDNLRHRLAAAFADAAESHARAEGGETTLTTAYEKTIAYRSIIAKKSMKTRKKNEEARKNELPAP